MKNKKFTGMKLKAVALLLGLFAFLSVGAQTPNIVCSHMNTKYDQAQICPGTLETLTISNINDFTNVTSIEWYYYYSGNTQPNGFHLLPQATGSPILYISRANRDGYKCIVKTTSGSYESTIKVYVESGKWPPLPPGPGYDDEFRPTNKTWYVKAGSNKYNVGLTPTGPAELANLLNDSRNGKLSIEDGDTILIAGGTHFAYTTRLAESHENQTYCENRKYSFIFNASVVVLGGWNEDFTVRDPEVYKTILSGDYDSNDDQGIYTDNAYQVAFWNTNPAVNSILDGVTITGGYNLSGKGAGMYLANGNLELRNVNFAGNKGIEGTGLYIANPASATVFGSTFSGNVVSGQSGSAILCESPNNLKIAYSTFVNNTFDGASAGNCAPVVSSSVNTYIYHSTFIGNKAPSNAAAFYAQGGGKITYGGNIICGNTNGSGTKLYIGKDGSSTLINEGHNVFGNDISGSVGTDLLIDPSAIAGYFAGGTLSNNLYTPKLTSKATDCVVPEGSSQAALIVVPQATTTGWLTTVFGTLPNPLTDQRGVTLAAIGGKYYAGSVNGANITGLTANIKILLQGPLKTDGTMTNDIQIGDTDGNFETGPKLPVSDPYGLSTTYTEINTNVSTLPVVDWILVEVWNLNLDTEIKTVLERKALLLKPNGQIVDTNGNPPVFASQTGAVRIVVKHRNHLSVMSNEISSFTGTINYDFSTGLDKAFKYDSGDPNPMVQRNGFWTLWAGDLNDDGTIDSKDRNAFNSGFKLSPSDDYIRTDLNMDGVVDSKDRNTFNSNFKTSPSSPIVNF